MIVKLELDQRDISRAIHYYLVKEMHYPNDMLKDAEFIVTDDTSEAGREIENTRISATTSFYIP